MARRMWGSVFTVLIVFLLASSAFADMPGPLTTIGAGYPNPSKYVNAGLNYSNADTQHYFSNHRHVWMGDWSQTSLEKYRLVSYCEYNQGALISSPCYSATGWVTSPQGGSSSNPGYYFMTGITVNKVGSYVAFTSEMGEKCVTDSFGKVTCPNPWLQTGYVYFGY